MCEFASRYCHNWWVNDRWNQKNNGFYWDLLPQLIHISLPPSLLCTLKPTTFIDLISALWISYHGKEPCNTLCPLIVLSLAPALELNYASHFCLQPKVTPLLSALEQVSSWPCCHVLAYAHHHVCTPNNNQQPTTTTINILIPELLQSIFTYHLLFFFLVSVPATCLLFIFSITCPLRWM